MSINQQYDSAVVLEQRSALRGRMVGSPDCDFLQQGIDDVQAALRDQADADDVGPANKAQRTTEESPEEEL